MISLCFLYSRRAKEAKCLAAPAPDFFSKRLRLLVFFKRLRLRLRLQGAKNIRLRPAPAPQPWKKMYLPAESVHPGGAPMWPSAVQPSYIAPRRK